MKNNNMKELILEKGMGLVSEKGFKNTGISEILKSASVPKGSFYYYFDSKTDFGIELINYAAHSFFSEIKRQFSKETPAMERIESFFNEQISYFQSQPCRCNCIFGKLSQELTDKDPLLREELLRIFNLWMGLIAEALKEAEREGTAVLRHSADSLARFFLSGWEGAMMQSKLHRSIEPLKEFQNIFLSMISPKI